MSKSANDNSIKQGETENNSVICPFLSWPEEPTVRYGFPHRRNFCHKPKRIQAVNFRHQNEYCLSSRFSECPVFLSPDLNQLPADIRGRFKQQQIKERIISWQVVIPVVLIGVIALVLLSQEIFRLRNSQNGKEKSVTSGEKISDSNLVSAEQNISPSDFDPIPEEFRFKTIDEFQIQDSELPLEENSIQILKNEAIYGDFISGPTEARIFSFQSSTRNAVNLETLNVPNQDTLVNFRNEDIPAINQGFEQFEFRPLVLFLIEN